jgi:hypothetical protein
LPDSGRKTNFASSDNEFEEFEGPAAGFATGRHLPRALQLAERFRFCEIGEHCQLLTWANLLGEGLLTA